MKISSLLAKAVKIWLKTQVKQTEGLKIQIQANNRAILRGYIPQIAISADYGVYRGLHLQNIEIMGKNIKINWQGTSLILLEPIKIKAQVIFTNKNLQDSLSSELLSQALTDLLSMLVSVSQVNSQEILTSYQIDWREIELKKEQLIFLGIITNEQARRETINLAVGCQLEDRQTINLSPVKIVSNLPGLDLQIKQYFLNLGKEVELEKIAIVGKQLVCQGSLTINPS